MGSPTRCAPASRSVPSAAACPPRPVAGGSDARAAAAAREGGCAAGGRSRPRSRRAASPPSASSEAAGAGLVLAERGLERSPVEVRPERVAEDELGVSALPQQEVRDPLLAAGPDQEVGVVHLGRVQMVAELLL